MLWGGDAVLEDVKASISTATVDDEARTVQFGASSTVSGPFCGTMQSDGIRRGVPFMENAQYTFITTLSKSSGTGSNMRVYYSADTSSYDNIPSVSAAGVKETVVLNSKAAETVTRLAKLYSSGNTTLYADECGIFEGVLTAEDFEAYKGEEVSEDWETVAGTVYGGSLDVLNGTLTVTHGCYDSYAGQTLPGEWMSDRDVYTPGGIPTTGAQVVYALAEPVVYRLDPAEVTTLAGANNVYADCGPVESLVYVRDTGAAIEVGDAEISGMIAEDAPGSVASRNYAVGEFLTAGGKLYRTTAAIASGETIVPGTNAAETTVGEQLAAIWAVINS